MTLKYVAGISSGAKAHFLANYITKNNTNFLVAVIEDDIDNIYQDIQTFLNNKDITVLFRYLNTNTELSDKPYSPVKGAAIVAVIPERIKRI